jgi:acetyl-CoA carboxylase carboxyl transferase subunit alpha
MLSVSQKLGLLRNLGRPSIKDFIPLLFDDFIELHGDRLYGDDPAFCCGVALFQKKPVTVIAQVRGRDIDELQRVNFSMPHPEGFRKAIRLAKEAEKFRRPVLCFIDTPGAHFSVGAEERGQGEAIARSLLEFMRLKTPVVSVVLGEGGSGGALAIGVCDRLGMLENALYSVISPKGFASILWKDPNREKEAAELMKITAQDLLQFGICDAVIPEPEGGAHNDIKQTALNIEEFLAESVKELASKEPESLPAERYEKFRKIR